MVGKGLRAEDIYDIKDTFRGLNWRKSQAS